MIVERNTTRELYHELSNMTLEELIKAKEEFLRKYPAISDKPTALCAINTAIEQKKVEKEEIDLLHIIRSIKSAPDGAATPSQGNVTQ